MKIYQHNIKFLSILIVFIIGCFHIYLILKDVLNETEDYKNNNKQEDNTNFNCSELYFSFSPLVVKGIIAFTLGAVFSDFKFIKLGLI